MKCRKTTHRGVARSLSGCAWGEGAVPRFLCLQLLSVLFRRGMAS
ncbi:hypothetical protein [Methanomassiliicoccus luminyensis]|nr:hypothetical protein [Methanomassiliicoccus luminyensis]